MVCLFILLYGKVILHFRIRLNYVCLTCRLHCFTIMKGVAITKCKTGKSVTFHDTTVIHEYALKPEFYCRFYGPNPASSD